MTIPDEHTEQVALFRWAALTSRRLPQLKLLYAIPNGGHRHKAVAAKLKAEGVKSGVPDVFLPVPSGGFHGLYIEMKRRKGGTVSAEQKRWIEALGDQGYLVEVCKGWESAVAVIEDYLSW